MKYFLSVSCVLLFFSCAVQHSQTSPDKTDQPPNIIFIMTDDHAKRAMSAYSQELIRTPHLDQLAE